MSNVEWWTKLFTTHCSLKPLTVDSGLWTFNKLITNQPITNYMDWGKGIILTLTAFAGIIISMVVICVRQDDIHLVTQNYYEEEIKYQDQIDKMVNASMLDYEALAFDANVAW